LAFIEESIEGAAMSTGLPTVLVPALAVGLLATAVQRAPEPSSPTVPYVDLGACPFEGCVYREWVANDSVAVLRARRPRARVVFTVRKGERVQALTGAVVTIKAGRVRFRQSVTLKSSSGQLHVEPSQILFLLTYKGEGVTKAWFDGRIFDDVDLSNVFNGLCETDPTRCIGTIVEQPTSVWWVRIRNGRGEVGWTDEPQKFDRKDALGN
jgi:hypothetical protein